MPRSHVKAFWQERNLNFLCITNSHEVHPCKAKIQCQSKLGGGTIPRRAPSMCQSKAYELQYTSHLQLSPLTPSYFASRIDDHLALLPQCVSYWKRCLDPAVTLREANNARSPAQYSFLLPLFWLYFMGG